MDLPSDFHLWSLARQREWLRMALPVASESDLDELHANYLVELFGSLPSGYCGWGPKTQRAWWYWSGEAHGDTLARTDPEGVARFAQLAMCRSGRWESESASADGPSPVVDFLDDMRLFGGADPFIAWKRAHPNTHVAEYVGQEGGAALGAVVGGPTRAAGQMIVESRTPARRTRHAVGPRRVRRRGHPTRIDTTRPRGSQVVTASYTVPQPAATAPASPGMPMWPIYVGASVAALALGYVAYRAMTRNTTRHPSGRRDDSIAVRDLGTGRTLRI